ncbi:MAG: hypothetical protein HQK99_15995 [Nitrospirae bacterium]|nr:hypothetical protein [Nitrospirota bacterium]
MRQTVFPPGWDEEKVRSVLAHYEQQTDDEAIAEDELAFSKHILTTMTVPNDLVPTIRKLIAKRRKLIAKRRNAGK